MTPLDQIRAAIGAMVVRIALAEKAFASLDLTTIPWWGIRRSSRFARIALQLAQDPFFLPCATSAELPAATKARTAAGRSLLVPLSAFA
jgi:hypothetical protein